MVTDIPDGIRKPMIAAAVDDSGDAIDDHDMTSLALVGDTTCEPLADDGPCSLLCDPDALIEQYVPEGMCVHFVCTLRDGTPHSTGACH